MLRRIENLYDFTIRGTDGDVGEVHDFYFDGQTWQIRYLVVETGSWLFGRRVLISPVALQPPLWDEEVLPVNLTQAQIENSPPVTLDQPVSEQELESLHTYYGWPWPWIGSPLVHPTPGYVPPPIPPAAEVEGVGEEVEGDPHLRSTREVIGYHIQARDDEVGHLEDFFAGEEWTVQYMLVDTRNWLPGRKVLLAPSWVEEISWPEGQVYVDLKRKTIEESPEYDPSQPLTAEYARLLEEHYRERGASFFEERS
jgi:hypothetical protein